MLATLLAVGAAPGRGGSLAYGEALLKQGKPRQALQVLAQLRKEQPDNQRVAFSYAVAQGRTGACQAALPTLVEMSERRVLNAATVQTTVACMAHAGQGAEAEALAVALAQSAPLQVGAHTLVLRLRAQRNDLAAAQAALPGVMSATHGEQAHLPLQAELALRDPAGDPDGWLDQLKQQPGWHAMAGHLEVWRWLDLGDALAAERAAADLARFGLNPALSVARAEALRRLGHPHAALDILMAPVVGEQVGGGFALSVQARVYVDLGDLEAASEVLSGHATPWDRPALESAWYLARAAEDASGMEAAAANWARLAKAPEPRLVHLLPL